MEKYLSKSFTTTDPRVSFPPYLATDNQRKYDASPDLQLDETQTPWRVTTQENNVAIVNTYTVQPNNATPATPGAEAGSPGDEDDDGDGLDQLSVRSTRSYHVNNSKSKKSPRKGSVQANQGVTPPPSTTFSPPLAQGQFLSPEETQYNPYDYAQTNTYEGLGIAGGVAPQGYTLAPMTQYIASPTIPAGSMPAQYLRSPMMLAPQPLQPLQQGNPEIQRQPRMVPVQVLQSPIAQQVPFQPGVMKSPQRLVRQNTQPLPRQMMYDENTLMQAALLSQIRQHQQQQQQQQLPQEYLSPVPIPSSPQRLPRPISRSVPSSPEKRKFANQLAQVSELDIMSIPTPLVSSPIQPRQQQPKAQEQHLEQPTTSHLRGISFLDELFGGGDPESATPKAKRGPLAPDGTLRDDDEGDDNADLEDDVEAWLQAGGNLTEGTGWLDEVVLN